MDEALVHRLGDPISVDASADVSVCCEPEYEQVQSEITKLVSPDATPV